MEMRLQKYMAHAGICSRRKAEELISQGKIIVNGKVVKELGLKINTKKDIVKYNGKVVKNNEKMTYIMLNKPVGYITTVDDQFNRPTVIDLVSGLKERVYPVGRLDYDTSGLLFLTNDGQLTYRLTHPKHKVNKRYIVTVKHRPSKSKIESLRRGIDLGDFVTAPARVRVLFDKKDGCVIEVIIHEGKNRQVRRMFEAIGLKVKRLKRVSIGDIILGDLEEGKYRMLSKKEIEYLKSL